MRKWMQLQINYFHHKMMEAYHKEQWDLYDMYQTNYMTLHLIMQEDIEAGMI